MPDSFVQPTARFKVERRFWSRRTRWGAMAASPPARLEGSPSAVATSLLPGRQRTAWLIVLGGWTIVGLGYFCSQALAATKSGGPASWLNLIVFSLGTAW